MHWRRKWQPTPVFLPGETQGRGSLVAAVYGVAQSQTRLKQLSSKEFGVVGSDMYTCLKIFTRLIHMYKRFSQMVVGVLG